MIPGVESRKIADGVYVHELNEAAKEAVRKAQAFDVLVRRNWTVKPYGERMLCAVWDVDEKDFVGAPTWPCDVITAAMAVDVVLEADAKVQQ